jgi:cytochrome c-type biogenesis protein CcmH
VGAQDARVDADAMRIYSEVMSPYCPGLLLADCPSTAAFELRAEIRKRLEAGQNAAEIEAWLYEQYGDAIRAVPPARGWGLWLWVLPLMVFVLSLGAVAWFVRRGPRLDGAAAEPTPGAPSESSTHGMEQRLQDELDDL